MGQNNTYYCPSGWTFKHVLGDPKWSQLHYKTRWLGLGKKTRWLGWEKHYGLALKKLLLLLSYSSVSSACGRRQTSRHYCNMLHILAHFAMLLFKGLCFNLGSQITGESCCCFTHPPIDASSIFIQHYADFLTFCTMSPLYSYNNYYRH